MWVFLWCMVCEPAEKKTQKKPNSSRRADDSPNPKIQFLVAFVRSACRSGDGATDAHSTLTLALATLYEATGQHQSTASAPRRDRLIGFLMLISFAGECGCIECGRTGMLGWVIGRTWRAVGLWVGWWLLEGVSGKYVKVAYRSAIQTIASFLGHL